MSENTHQKNKIALFPLKIVLFPDEQIPLHIFEDRYKQMIHDCHQKKNPFGITSFINHKISKIGCLCHIEDIVQTYPDESMDIICKGGDRFLVHQFYNDLEYMEASVSYFHDENHEEYKTLREDIQPLIFEMLSLADDGLLNKMPNISLLTTSFQVAHFIGLELAQKQNLLEIKSEKERLLFIKDHLENSLPRIRGFEEMRNRIKSNGHFRKLPPISF